MDKKSEKTMISLLILTILIIACGVLGLYIYIQNYKSDYRLLGFVFLLFLFCLLLIYKIFIMIWSLKYIRLDDLERSLVYITDVHQEINGRQSEMVIKVNCYIEDEYFEDLTYYNIIFVDEVKAGTYMTLVYSIKRFKFMICKDTNWIDKNES